MDCCDPTIWQKLTPIAIIISGLLGSFIAIESIRSAREIARKKAAIDFLTTSQTNELIKDAFYLIVDLHRSHEQEIDKYAYVKDDADHLKTRDNILYLLNNMENMSVAIKEGIYDEQTIKESRYTGVVRTWRMTRRFIYKMREQLELDTLYMEFEGLAERWQEHPLTPRQSLAERKSKWDAFFRTE